MINKMYQFLKATRGNWHNAIYIKCSSLLCPHGNLMPCEGILMAIDADGSPIFMPVETLRNLSGESIDPEECCITLNKHTFEAAYVECHTDSPENCSLKQLCGNADTSYPCSNHSTQHRATSGTSRR